MSAYIVLVPTRHPRLFLATFCARDGSATWCAEYPNAHVFSRLRLAMCAARLDRRYQERAAHSARRLNHSIIRALRDSPKSAGACARQRA